VGVAVKGSNNAIRNGTINNFITGISLTNTTAAIVSGITITSSSSGGFSRPEIGADIFGDHAVGTQLRDVRVFGSLALVVDHGSSATVTDSTVVYRDQREGSPVSRVKCAHSSSCTFSNSTLRIRDIYCAMDEEPWDPSTVALDNNREVSMPGVGSKCSSVTVRNNTNIRVINVVAQSVIFTGNIVLATPTDEVIGTSVTAEQTFDIRGNLFSAGKSYGLSASGGTGSIVGNQFIENGLKGLDIGFGGPVTITGNEFRRNGRAREQFNEEAGGLILSSSVVGRQIILQDNHAWDNTVYGIMVGTGAVTDNGGNTSSGDERPCKGVTCNG
jgi:hypothetical protein